MMKKTKTRFLAMVLAFLMAVPGSSISALAAGGNTVSVVEEATSVETVVSTEEETTVTAETVTEIASESVETEALELAEEETDSTESEDEAVTETEETTAGDETETTGTEETTEVPEIEMTTEAAQTEETQTLEVADVTADSTDTVNSMSALLERFGYKDTEKGKVITITENIVLGGVLTVSDNTILIPDGKRTITRGSGMETQDMFRVKSGATLSLGTEYMDDADVLTIDGGAKVKQITDNGSKIWINEGSQAYSATAIYNEAGGKVVLYDGVVIQNHAIYNEDVAHLEEHVHLNRFEIASAITNYGTFTMKGGIIQKNQNVVYEWTDPYGSGYNHGGASVILNKGENALFIMESGFIVENYPNHIARMQGDILNVLGRMEIRGGKIKGSTHGDSLSDSMWFNIGIENMGNLLLEGGTIDNFVTAVKNSPISYNPTENILMDDSYRPNFAMTGGTILIKDNSKQVSGFNFGIRNHADFTMSGGEIILPASCNDGTGIVNECSTATYSSGDIYEEYFSMGVASLTGGRIVYNGSVPDYDPTTGIASYGVLHVSGNAVVEGFGTGIEFGHVTPENVEKAGEIYEASTVSGGIVRNCSEQGITVMSDVIMTGGNCLNNNIGIEVFATEDKYIPVVFTLKGGLIKGNGNYTKEWNRYEGAGVVVRGYNDMRATFIMDGGTIKGNKRFIGSAITGIGSSNIILNGGEITANFAALAEDPDGYSWNAAEGITDGSVYVEVLSYKENTHTFTIAEGMKDVIIHDNFVGQTPVEPKVTSMAEEMTLSVSGNAALQTVTNPKGAAVTYTSTNPEVAAVESGDIVTAYKPGETDIQASIDGEVFATCHVTVKNMWIEVPDTKTLARGETMTVQLVEETDAGVVPVTGTVKWETDSEYVLEIEGNNDQAVITGVGAGSAKVIAKVGENTDKKLNQIVVTKEMQVTVPVTGIEIARTEKTIHLPYGAETRSQAIKAYITPADGNDGYIIKWESDNTNVVTVEEEGALVQFTALDKGEANLTAKLYDADTMTLRASSKPCKVVVTRGISSSSKTEKEYGVLTNTHKVLDDIKLDANYSWKESYPGESKETNLESYYGLQYFTAVYEDNDYQYQEFNVPVSVGTVSGVKVTDESGAETKALKMEAGKASKRTLNMEMAGDIYLLSEGYAPVFEMAVTKGGDGLVIANSEDGWTIEATDAAKGKNYSVTAYVILPGGDRTQKTQKGKLWFEKVINVSVLNDGQYMAGTLTVSTADEETAQIEVVDGNKYIFRGKEHLEKGSNTVSLQSKILSVGGEDISSNVKVKWSTGNKTVATVDAKGKVTLKGVGKAIVTVAAADGSGLTDQVIIEVTDYCPRLEESTVTLNSAVDCKMTLQFHMPQEAKWSQEPAVAVYSYDSKSKTYTDASDKFELTHAYDNTFYISLKAAGKTAKNKTQKYTLSFVPSVVNSKTGEALSIEPKYGSALKVTVVNKTPSVKFKQNGKVNLFYKDAGAYITLTGDAALVESVKWVQGEEADFVINQSEAELYLKPALTSSAIKADGTVDLKKVDTKGVVNVYFYGMQEPVQVKLNVSVENKKPVYAFKTGTLKVYPQYGIMGGWDTIIDKKSKEVINLSDMTKSVATEGFVLKNTSDIEGKVELEVSTEKVGKKADVVLSCDNWNGTVTVSEKFKAVQPKPVLSEKTVTLNSKNTLDRTEPVTVNVNLDGAEYLADFYIGKFEGADAKTKKLLKDASLVVKKGTGVSLSLGLQEYMKGEERIYVQPGNYSLFITPAITVDGKTTTLAKQKLTIKVADKEITAALKGKGRINNLNRNEVSGTTYTVTLKNTSAKPVSVKMTGAESAIISKTVVNEQGKVEIYFKEDAKLKLKHTYKMIPVLTLSDGTTVTAGVIKMTVSQPSVKAVPDVKNVTLYASEDKNVYGSNLYFNIQSKDPYLAGDGRIVDVVSQTRGFKYDLTTNTLYVSDRELVSVGKTTTVKFVVTLQGEAVNGKQITTNVKVNVKP